LSCFRDEGDLLRLYGRRLLQSLPRSNNFLSPRCKPHSLGDTLVRLGWRKPMARSSGLDAHGRADNVLVGANCFSQAISFGPSFVKLSDDLDVAVLDHDRIYGLEDWSSAHMFL
jgi:hypothetical protein